MSEGDAGKEWLADAMELSVDAIICIDERHDIRFFNRGAEAVFGYTAAEIADRPLSILIPERFRAAHVGQIHAFASSPVTARHLHERDEVVGLRKDGREFWAEAAITKTVVGGEQVFTVLLRDVTERRLAEETLERREAAIRELYGITSNPALDLDGKIRAYLELGCHVFDLEQGVLADVVEDRYEVLHAYPESEAVHPGSVFEVSHTYCERTLASLAPVGFARAEGSEWQTHPCYGWSRLEAYLGCPVMVGDEVFGTLSFSSLSPRERAISDAERDLVRLMSLWIGNELQRQQRQDAEHVLAEVGRIAGSSLDFETTVLGIARVVVDSIGGACALFVIGADGQVHLAGAASADADWEATFQADSGRAIPDSPAFRLEDVLLTGEPRLAVRRADVLSRQARKGPDAAPEGVDPVLRFDPESAMIVPLSARGERFGAMLFGSRSPGHYQRRDLMWAVPLADRAAAALDNARAHHAVKAAVRRRDDLLAFVAHDLRNPLSAISMAVQHLLESPLDEEHSAKTRHRLEGVLGAANRMENLIQDLLDLQLVVEGRLPTQRADVPTAELLDAATSVVQVQIEGRGLTLDSYAGEGLVVRVDRNRVLRILANLLDNAIKFTDEGGRISLRVAEHDEDVLFSVSDTGVGIARERLPTLFDRFARRDDGKEGSAGLGLDIARQIVEAHDGTMWVESEPGVGTTFFFTLPKAGGA